VRLPFLFRMPLWMITLVSFQAKLHGSAFYDSPHDSVKWDLNSNGIFFVKSFYMKLVPLVSSPIQLFPEDHFPCKIIWKSVAPLEVSFFFVFVFVWEASDCCTLTCDNLKRRDKVLDLW